MCCVRICTSISLGKKFSSHTHVLFKISNKHHVLFIRDSPQGILPPAVLKTPQLICLLQGKKMIIDPASRHCQLHPFSDSIAEFPWFGSEIKFYQMADHLMTCHLANWSQWSPVILGLFVRITISLYNPGNIHSNHYLTTTTKSLYFIKRTFTQVIPVIS